MKSIRILVAFTIMLLAQSCSTPKDSIFWVSGFKTPCSAGAGKMQCLNIYRGENLDSAKWENFYAPIEGFVFEEGYLKKIQVKEEKLENVPADASSIKYTLVRELEKQADARMKLNGQWVLSRINDAPVGENIRLPELEIRLDQMQVSGTSGCNNYTSRITKLTQKTMQLGNVAGTRKACFIEHIEQAYYDALNTVHTYEADDEKLVLYDESGKQVLSFIPKPENTANQRLHDIWIAARIAGQPINRMSPLPRMELNLTEMRVTGTDGCNDYTGSIKEVSDSQLTFGPLASTKKMCRNMDTPDKFNKALNNVAAYRLEGLKLILLDSNGQEVLAFMKGD